MVRLLNQQGEIYEGPVQGNSKNGWGRLITNDSIQIGDWNNGELVGSEDDPICVIQWSPPDSKG